MGQVKNLNKLFKHMKDFAAYEKNLPEERKKV